MFQSVYKLNRRPKGGRDRSRARLAKALRLVPTIAAVSLSVALAGACGNSIYPVVSDTATATPTITTSPTTGNFLFSTNNTAGTIAEFTRNLSSGALTLIGSVAAGSANGPTGIASGRSAKYIYAVNSADDEVRQYKVNLTTGVLTPIGTGKIATGSSPQWIAFTPNTQFAFVTNSSDKSVSPYLVNATTGALTANGSAATSSLLSEPTTAVATNNFLYVTDDTKSSIVTFPIQAAGTLGDGKATSLNPAQGPPAVPGPIIMNAAKTFVYVTDQSKGVVYFLKVGSGVLTLANSYTSTGTGGSIGLAIATTTAGLSFMYVANQSLNPIQNPATISAFLINGDGTLTPLGPPQYADPSLSEPTGVAVDPTGTYLYVANQGTGTVSQFTISPSTGALSIGVPVTTGSTSNGTLYLSLAD